MIKSVFGWEKALGIHPTKEWKMSSVAILTDKSTSNLEITQAKSLAAESSSRTKKKLCIMSRSLLLHPRFMETFTLKPLPGQGERNGGGYEEPG